MATYKVRFASLTNDDKNTLTFKKITNAVLDGGHLRLDDEREVAALFAPGEWRYCLKVSDTD
jgi:hypothetical protein